MGFDKTEFYRHSYLLYTLIYGLGDVLNTETIGFHFLLEIQITCYWPMIFEMLTPLQLA